MYTSGSIDVRNWVHLFKSPCISKLHIPPVVWASAARLCLTQIHVRPWNSCHSNSSVWSLGSMKFNTASWKNIPWLSLPAHTHTCSFEGTEVSNTYFYRGPPRICTIPGGSGRQWVLGGKGCWQFKCIQIPCREQEMGPTFTPNKNSGPATGMESQNPQSVPQKP